MLSVSIGIPAYNEAANIKQLLEALLRQKQDSFVLKEIVVISDHSTDATAALVKSVPDDRIIFIEHEERTGKVHIFRELVERNTADVFIQLDADVRPGHDQVLSQMVAPIANEKAQLVCAYVRPVAPKLFAESVVYFGWQAWERVIGYLPQESQLLHRCMGAGRAFSKQYMDAYYLPPSISSSEDAYSYLFAKSKDWKVAFAHDALVYCRVSTNFSDYIKQMRRFMHNQVSNSQYFEPEMLNRITAVPGWYKIKALVLLGLKKPVRGLVYVFVQLYARLTASRYQKKNNWEVSISSKKFD